MSKTNSQIGRRATRILGYKMPNHWVYRSQEDQEDGGVDAEIELEDESSAIHGFIFKAQIKGKDGISFNSEGKTTFYLPMSKAKYYLYELKIPLLFVYVDTVSEDIYYKVIQNSILEQKYKQNQSEGRTNLNIVFSLDDKLDSYDLVIQEISKNFDWQRVKGVKDIAENLNRVKNSLSRKEVDKLLKNASKIRDNITIDNLEHFLVNLEFDMLEEESRKILISPSENENQRITAYAYLENAIVRGGYSRVVKNKERSRWSSYLLKIAREEKFERENQFLSIGFKRAEIFDIALERLYSSSMAGVGQSDGSVMSELMKPYFGFQIWKSYEQLRKTIHFLDRTIKKEDYQTYLTIFPRLVKGFAAFAGYLKLKDKKDSLEAFVSIYEHFIYTAKSIIVHFNIASHAKSIAFGYFFFLQFTDKEPRLIRQEIIELLDVSNSAQDKATLLSHFDGFNEKLKNKDRDVSIEGSQEAFKNIATSQGFDVNNPKTEDERLLATAIDDLDPRNIVKDCENLFVLYSGPGGMLGHSIGLPSAGMRTIYCSKLEIAVGTFDLDRAYEGFKSSHCEGCKFKCERDNNWEWSFEWQEEVQRKYSDKVL